MDIKIFVDSSADVPMSVSDKYKFNIVPLSVNFEDEVYLDVVEINPATFYEKLKVSKKMPTTSQVPPERFIEYIQPELDKGYEVIIVTMGSNASGTCQSAHIAKDTLETDKVTVIDSNCLSAGVTYIAIEVAKLVEKGFKPKEIKKQIKPLTENQIEHLFCVDTLEYLRRGGRIKATKAIIGEILNIKPILIVKDAITQPVHKVRGRKKIIPYYIERMKKDLDRESDMIIVAHSQDEVFANEFVNAIKKEIKWDKQIIMAEIGAIIGTHTGPGVLGCFYRRIIKDK